MAKKPAPPPPANVKAKATKKPAPKRAIKRPRPENLAHGRWLGDFEPLSEAEKRLVACAAKGEEWKPDGWDGTRPTEANDSNCLRADLIRFLLLGGDTHHPGDIMPDILGAWVDGRINISFVNCISDLALVKCHIGNGIYAHQAKLLGLYVDGSLVKELNAQQIIIEGNAFLKDGFKAEGQVSLCGARIGGQLSCSGGMFSNPGGHALNAQGVEVKGDIFLKDGFKAEGEVNLSGARIGGQLSCDGGMFSNPGGDALNVQDAEIKGNVFLKGSFKAEGEVSLSGAQIGGQLGCDGGMFSNLGGHALNAQGAEAKGDIFLRDGFKAEGEVSLSGAQIGGQLSCGGGTFSNPVGYALNAQGAEAKRSVFLSGGFKAEGVVSFSGAQIGGQLNCGGGMFSNPGGHAFNAHSVEVKGSVFLSGDFKADGGVSFSGAKIGGQLSCAGGRFNNPGAKALSAQGVDVKGSFIFIPTAITGLVDFTQAHVTAMKDDVAKWPTGKYFLDGFRYDRLHGNHEAKARIDWLNGQKPSKLNEDFAPHPWEHLAKVLRETGHESAAAEVAIAKQNAMRKAGQIGQRKVKEFPDLRRYKPRKWLDMAWNGFSNFMTRCWHRIYGLTAGYGYRPQRILYVLAAFIMISSVFYYGGRHVGLIGPTDPLIHLNAGLAQCGTGGDPGKIYWTDPACPVPPEYSTFQPFLYALDVTLPLVDLHQEADWGPVVTNKAGETLWWGRGLRWLMWLNIIVGWIASLMFVAIVSRLVEKD